MEERETHATLQSPLLSSRWGYLRLAVYAAVWVLFATHPELFGADSIRVLRVPVCAVGVLILALGVISNLPVLITTVLESCTVTILTYLTGSSESPFLFLYLIPVIWSALIGKRKIAYMAMIICICSYIALMTLLQTELLLTARGEIFVDPRGATLLNLVGLSSAMFLLTILTSYLSIRVKANTELMLHYKNDVESLKSQHKELQTQLENQEKMARLLLERPTQAKQHALGIIGDSSVMKKVYALIERVAPSDATVLISGESGTGKELVARAIHKQSSRKEKPFIAINCGAIPENLLESELFGYKKGSFTGADSDHLGLFRAANGGTLLLDEIGELPLHLQAKLLRVIQSRTVMPVGGEREITVDVRLLAATNRHLRKDAERGTFREDLYYRVNVININLPPLRERKDDIPLLIQSIAQRLTKNGQPPVITPATMQILLSYDYPGNVRELENMLERALVLGGAVILPEHLPEHVRITSGNSTKKHTEIFELSSISLPCKLDDILQGLERTYLEAALKETQGGRKKAAEILGINFRSLRYRLQKFSIEAAAEENDPTP